ncbi:MAG: HAD family hydrolase [Planctomycetales bacterium]|nr:HAD family hydrolase [Planctomycetales bacterium]
MIEFKPEHEFFVGIDSDGCTFDTMELKHKECFIPQFINHYELQGVSKYAREAAEFVNLYSKSRGCNRFNALVEQLEWLRQRPEVLNRGVQVPKLVSVEKWLTEETKLGNPALKQACESSGDAELKQALDWSEDVNATVKRIVRGVPPFPYVRECLDKLAARCDMLCVSATPNEALEAEWAEHGLRKYVRAICGQEIGTKKETLALSKPFDPSNRLMIGDAPGDFKAAMANGCQFFPINPGDEEASWQALYEEGIERFFNGSFAGDYQNQLLADFDARLPERPHWK